MKLKNVIWKLEIIDTIENFKSIAYESWYGSIGNENLASIRHYKKDKFYSVEIFLDCDGEDGYKDYIIDDTGQKIESIMLLAEKYVFEYITKLITDYLEE